MPMKIFLFPPEDSCVSVLAPNPNDGADPTYAAGSCEEASAGFSNRSAAGAGGFSSIFGFCGSSAGAGALAAPLVIDALATGGLNSLVTVGADVFAGAAGVATAALYKTGGVAGAAGAGAFSATGAAVAGTAGAGFAAACCAGHAAGALGFGVGATGFGGSGEAGLAADTGGFGAAGLGVAVTCDALGAGGVLGAAAGALAGADGTAKLPVAVALPGLPGSLLRSNPRATRRVPFACSMLMGLVRTRFAPMRNAFATPA